MAANQQKNVLIGCLVMCGLSMVICVGCFSFVGHEMEKQAEYARTPEGKAELEKSRQERRQRDLERTAWIMTQDFAEDHIRGKFDWTPTKVEATGDGAWLVSGNCATPDGKVHRIVGEMENTTGDKWKCRALWIDARQVR